MENILGKLLLGRDLAPAEAEGAMRFVMSGKASEDQIGRFLLGLKKKGETIEEITAFARVLREFSIKVSIKPELLNRVVDTCGSGGDEVKTFNVSTAAAFVAAGAGVPIAKHGNRSVSSKSGSADVLENLGVEINLDAARVAKCIEQVGIGFMFAPIYHSAMKNVSAVRKQLATRTVFNILGPLISPAGVKRQVYGIYDASLTEKLAGVLKELGCIHALVVHGMDGLDELSTIGETKVSELKNGQIKTYYITPADCGLRKASPEKLAGGTPAENATTIRSILTGEAGPGRDIVILNAAAAIYVGGVAKDLKEGMTMAERSIDTGKAFEKLQKLVEISND